MWCCGLIAGRALIFLVSTCYLQEKRGKRSFSAGVPGVPRFPGATRMLPARSVSANQRYSKYRQQEYKFTPLRRFVIIKALGFDLWKIPFRIRIVTSTSSARFQRFLKTSRTSVQNFSTSFAKSSQTDSGCHMTSSQDGTRLVFASTPPRPSLS